MALKQESRPSNQFAPFLHLTIDTGMTSDTPVPHTPLEDENKVQSPMEPLKPLNFKTNKCLLALTQSATSVNDEIDNYINETDAYLTVTADDSQGQCPSDYEDELDQECKSMNLEDFSSLDFLLTMTENQYDGT